MPWNFASLNTEGSPVLIQGADIWKYEWKSQGEEPVDAQHPSYPGQSHALKRYFVQADGKIIQFAAAEVSPGAWLIYQLDDSPETKTDLLAALALCCFGVAGLAFRFGELSEYKTLATVALGLAGGVALGAVSFSRRGKGEA